MTNISVTSLNKWESQVESCIWQNVTQAPYYLIAGSKKNFTLKLAILYEIQVSE